MTWRTRSRESHAVTRAHVGVVQVSSFLRIVGPYTPVIDRTKQGGFPMTQKLDK